MGPASSHGGRIANVAGAVLVLPGSERRARAFATLLETLFEEVVIVALDGSPSDVPLGRIVEALEAATADRVLIVGTGLPEPPLALLLALTAWPEQDAVLPFRDDQPVAGCAIYRRLPVLEAARRVLAAGQSSVESLLAEIDVGSIEGEDLAAVCPT